MSNFDYKKFESLARVHTKFIYKEKEEVKESLSPPPIIKFYCSRGFVEEIKERGYAKIKYEGVNLYLVIFQSMEKVGKIAFVFYDFKRSLDELALTDYLLRDEELKLTEVQIRQVVGLEETLEKKSKQPN